MRAYKKQKKKAFLASKGIVQSKAGNTGTPKLKDSRIRAITQTKLQGIANKSTYVAQLSGLQSLADSYTGATTTLQKKKNQTGLPDTLKVGIENLSGFAMDDVKVHYNSAKPAQLQAHAYAQGAHIHLAPGQEKNLPHEAWHVVQQKQGRVRPTMQMKGRINVNDDPRLEKEADVMGDRASKVIPSKPASHLKKASSEGAVQCRFIKVKGLKWKDLKTGKVYDQAEVQTDNRVKIKGHGEIFYIYYFDSQWNRKGVAPDLNARPANLPGFIPVPSVSTEQYSQDQDQTVTPFLKAGRKFMGQRGAESQAVGKVPSESHIREEAQEHDDISGGAGLHELMPTNMRGKVASSGDEVMRGIQSGARSSTALTAFNRRADPKDKIKTGDREAGLHTGFASKPSKRKGQAAAHDRMRELFNAILVSRTVEEAVNLIIRKHIEIIVRGEDILNSEYLTGMTPHFRGIGKLEAVSKKPGPNRLALARLMHEIREGLKTRTRSLKRSDRTRSSRSPSPPRRGFSPSGKGGDYESSLRKEEYPVIPVPKFKEDSGLFEYTSNMAAWLTAPHRLGHNLQKEKEQSTVRSFVRPIAHVANLNELVSRSWNVGDRVEIAVMDNVGRNVRIRFLRNFHAGSQLTKADIWLELQGG